MFVGTVPFFLRLGHISGDQKVPVHLMITIQMSGAQRLFALPIYIQYFIEDVGVYMLTFSVQHFKCHVFATARALFILNANCE